MPDAADPMQSIGYLLAAATAAVLGLLAYAASVANRLRAARERQGSLRSDGGKGHPTPPSL